ncbi:MAG TPA: ectoine/hydroxyectoine ABC transporter permease subunit EhuD [Burkholderiales bacterium]|nr:ectoine/hydroxyectoine ABC transporter permease subunit EhuD [Burkholderiales bacterium]
MFDFAFALRILPKLADAAITSIWITLLSFVLALLLGVPLALLRRSRWPTVTRSTTAIVDFVRCTPLLVQLYFLYFALPGFGIRLSPLATGVIALSAHYGCYMSEVYRSGLEAIPRGQWDAAVALSLPRSQTYLSVILPQAITPIIPAAGNYLVHMFKETPLLSTISVVEMMFVSAEIGADSFRYLEPITLCGLLFLAMSITAAMLIRLGEAFYGLRWRRRWV